ERIGRRYVRCVSQGRADRSVEDGRAHPGAAVAPRLQDAVLSAARSMSTRSPASLDALTTALRRLPGVGARSAQRFAYYLLQHDREAALEISRALAESVAKVRHCARCNTFTEREVCETCESSRRDPSLLCVVETPADQLMIEQTHSYPGLYFVLMGRLSPIEGVGPRDIHFERLLERACAAVVTEAILA